MDIPLPLVPPPYKINDYITYITQFGTVKNGWIKYIKEYDAAKRPIINSDIVNRPRVFDRFYYFTQTRNATANQNPVNYKYVERLPDGIIIGQQWIIDNYVNENIPNYLREPIPEYPDEVAGNTGSTPSSRNKNIDGNTGGTSGGRRKRTRRHRSRRNQSRRSK